MTAPSWMDAIVRDFGRAAGAENFSLGRGGATAFAFENGISLRFEYPGGCLAVAAEVSAPCGPAQAARLLAHSHPDAAAQGAPVIRTGYLASKGRAVFVVKIPEREVTLPAVQNAFSALWRAAAGFAGGEAWA